MTGASTMGYRHCLAAGASLICGRNGLDYDGTLNCFTYEDNRCGSDAACCDVALGIQGVCTSGSAGRLHDPGPLLLAGGGSALPV
jgi:hypothetical protein